MDPSGYPYTDTLIPVQSHAVPTTKRPWSPPLLTVEFASATSGKPDHHPQEDPDFDGPGS